METDRSFSVHRKIDAHSHIGFFGSPFNVNFDGPALKEQMEIYNIRKTVLCSAGCSLNAEVLEVYRNDPEHVIPLYWINANQGKAGYDALEHALREDGFRGVKMQPLFDAFTADSPLVDPIMEIAESCSVPVFIHSGHPPFSLPWQIGLLAERHPHVRTVMVHMGHGHGVYIDASITMAKKYANIYLETSGMPMGCQIAHAYREVGHDRVFFGIDSPFHHPTVEIQRILSSGLTDTELEDVFYNNCAKFMHIEDQ